jgi:hypothetical protein
MWDLSLALFGTAVGVFKLSWHWYIRIRESAEWAGVRSYVIAFAVLVLAVAISAVKGGIGEQLQRIRSRMSGQ